MDRIILLGATGSIGKSTLDVIRNFPDRYQLLGISGYSNLTNLERIIHEFHPKIVCLKEEKPDLTNKYPDIHFLFGENGLTELAAVPEGDSLILAVSGIVGLYPLLKAIEGNKRILSANKEAIVAAGNLINHKLGMNRKTIIPLDSEHNAIYQLLKNANRGAVKNIILTASGGPFLNKPITKNTAITDVLNHPTWKMGQYITVNSATMMNKGFEVIEAHYLFNEPYENIRVLVHPQSLVHGALELKDGTFFLAASPSDMRYPIALAMFEPEIPVHPFGKLDLAGKSLDFSEPDLDKFPLLKMAYECGKAGQGYPAVLNAANEKLVELFLKEKIHFTDIPCLLSDVMESYKGNDWQENSIDAVMSADQYGRDKVNEIYNEL